MGEGRFGFRGQKVIDRHDFGGLEAIGNGEIRKTALGTRDCLQRVAAATGR